MAKKENLEKLLQILPKILSDKENDWFKVSLEKLIEAQNPNINKSNGGIFHAYAENTKEYIVINPEYFLIDYNDIPDEKVKTQLKMDCFEMARYRLGRINHKPDFDEFCRYAHLQIEELINYYYEKKFVQNLAQMKDDIAIFNPPNYTDSIKRARSLGQINFIRKSWALNNKMKFNSIVQNTIIRVCYIRNDLSHRTSLSKISDKEKLEAYQKKNGMIDNVFQISDEDIKTILFRNSQNWDEVFFAINYLKKEILAAL